jgi:uncharacterized protein
MKRRMEFAVGKQKLVGDLYLPDGLPASYPCVVTSHGYKSNRNSEKWQQVGARLPAAGIGVFTFDHRGALNGESDGKFENTTLSARLVDLQAALAAINQVPEIDHHRLGLLGSSLGGMDVLLTKNENIRCKVVMSTPFRIPPPTEVMRSAFTQQGYWDYADGTRIRKEFYADLVKFDVIAEISRDNYPLLIIHGDLDELVPRHHARILFDNAGAPLKSLHTVDGADHSFSDLEKLNEALSYAFDWFRRYLTG